MSEASCAPLRRIETYRDLVYRTAALLSQDLSTAGLIAGAQQILAEFFEAESVVVALGRDEDFLAAETLRVLRGEAATCSDGGRSLHVPIRFGAEVLGAVALAHRHGHIYEQSDLELLAEWGALFGVRINGSRLAFANSQLEVLVGTDALTGLRNRRGLTAELETLWEAARLTREAVAVVMVDVDFFKAYNDNYGHLAGDACLQQIALTIGSGLRPLDIGARFGGEEFVLVLRDTDRDAAVGIAERLRESIVARRLAHAGSTFESVTASFGIATVRPCAGDLAADAIAAADRLLYAAKAAGRNRVAATGYSSASPVLRPATGGAHNLPEQLSSFCGRHSDVAMVLEALTASRLVTLVAFGGIGKTRLSLEVAGQRRGSFRNGVWFVDLAGSADPELLAERVAAAIGLPDVPGSRTVGGVADLLQARELLIVLDNCEHLIDACAEFCTAVLGAAPAVRILATSRVQLGLADEVVISLAPLGLPPADANLCVADVAHYPALKLFVDRALAAAPIGITSQSLATIAHICRRLDGIALAIELAAARVRMLTLDELRARLDRAFNVIGRAGGVAVARQRTLRGLIDWSYDLLDERERRLFGRLGIFAGAFSLELATIIGTGDEGDPADVLDTLEELVDKSLVVLEIGATGTRTFRLFESIRDYAHERLAEAGETAAREAQLGREIQARAAAIAAASATPRWRVAMEPLAQCADDIRAYLQRTIVAGHDPLGGAVVAADLAAYWHHHGRVHEGRTWLERALIVPNLTPGVQARLLNAFLWHQPLFGDAWTSEALATQALALATQAGDEDQISAAIFHIGDAAFDLGDYSRSLDYSTRALDRFAAAGDAFGEAYACNQIGAARDLVSETVAGVPPSDDYTWYNRGIEICRRLERHGFAARILGNIGECEFFIGRVNNGIALTNEALRGVESENDRPAMGWLLCNLGLFYQSTAEFELAKIAVVDALRVVLEIRDHWLVAGCCDNAAGIALNFGRPDCAAQFLGCAESIFTDIKLSRQPVFARLAHSWGAHARELLGVERFDAQFAAGTTLSPTDLPELLQSI